MIAGLRNQRVLQGRGNPVPSGRGQAYNRRGRRFYINLACEIIDHIELCPYRTAADLCRSREQVQFTVSGECYAAR